MLHIFAWQVRCVLCKSNNNSVQRLTTHFFGMDFSRNFSLDFRLLAFHQSPFDYLATVAETIAISRSISQFSIEFPTAQTHLDYLLCFAEITFPSTTKFQH